jgi:hypothetical protein
MGRDSNRAFHRHANPLGGLSRVGEGADMLHRLASATPGNQLRLGRDGEEVQRPPHAEAVRGGEVLVEDERRRG